jgi:hypothetical protein
MAAAQIIAEHADQISTASAADQRSSAIDGTPDRRRPKYRATKSAMVHLPASVNRLNRRMCAASETKQRY